MITDMMKKIGLKTFLLTLVFSLSAIPFSVQSQEIVPDRIFEGRKDPVSILENLDYTDVNSAGTWAMDAIWETGALELMKGYGEKRFGLADLLTVEQAIALAYNMAGREAEAQLAAEALDLLREAGDRKITAPAMWSDGYIQLALNDGLITQEDYDDAFAQNQSGLSANDFRRNSPATREDMAFFIARTLEIAPVHAQTHLFNHYSDWNSANPHRIPYIEALLQNRVMNGNNGIFNPKGAVTREQAAQMIQNAEPFIFSRLNIEKYSGTIDSISQYIDRTSGQNTTVTQITVRTNGGRLHQFQFSHPPQGNGNNEMTGDKNNNVGKGTIVNTGGILKDSTALKEEQEISYFVRNGEVLYCVVLSEQKKTENYLARILSVDEQSSEIRSEILLQVPFDDVRMLKPESLYDADFNSPIEVLSVSVDAAISIDLLPKALGDVVPGQVYLLKVENRLVTAMEKVNAGLFKEEGIVSGILEENNPILGYVTLYFPDGSGTSPEAALDLSVYRTYSYLNADQISVSKNGNPARLEDLQPGDSVFLKLDADGYLIQISGADNYYPVYGRIRTKGNGTVQLEREDGTVEQLHIPMDAPIFRDRKRITWNELDEGDKVRVLLQTAGNRIAIGEITIEKNNAETTGVYKAELAYYDNMDKSLVVSGLQQFKDGIWKPAGDRGVTRLTVNEKYNPSVPRGAQGTVYMATGKNILGNDTVIRMVIDNESLLTEIISDTIVEVQPGHGSLTLMNRNSTVTYGDNSLIIKEGRLLESNQVKNQDNVYVVAGNLLDGSQKANIVWLQQTYDDTGLTLLRGRISQINAMESMTLESFSQFRSPGWEYMNVPKTLTIDPYTTRLFDDDGRTDIADFDDVGANSYKNRTVYVLAQNGKAMMISTAPYGDMVYSGRISRLSGGQKDAFGHVVTPPSSFTIEQTLLFNPDTWLWENESDTSMPLPVNAIFTKNGRIIDAVSLEEGDRITVIRSQAQDEAWIVMAESY